LGPHYWAVAYISNGAAIVAAHALGFAIERLSQSGGPNAGIGINKRNIVQLTRPLGWWWP
jgi:hypothetical protein